MRHQSIEFNLALVPAPDDPPLGTQTCQSELFEFYQSLVKSEGIEVTPAVTDVSEPMSLPLDSHTLPKVATFLGDYAIKITAILGPVLGTAIGAWLHGRYGRKVRLKIGDVEAEAQTVDEGEQLLDHAAQFQQSHQSNIIQKP